MTARRRHLVRLFRSGTWAACLAAALSGCALLAPRKPADPPSPATAPAVRLTIAAPELLAALLNRHLDLARLQAMGDDAAIDDAELDRLVAALPTQAQELLQTEGYFDARVDARIASRGGDPDIRDATRQTTVQVDVDAGPRSRVGELTLDAAGELQRRLVDGQPDAQGLLDALRRDWPMRRGAPFRNDDWVVAKAQTLERLRAAGYAAADIAESAAEVDTAAQQVALRLRVDSGPRFLVGALRVEGLKHHDAGQVLGLVRLVPGQPITEAVLLDAQDRLRKTDLFEGVSITADTDPAQALAATVTVQLRESPLQQATVGVGYSANTGQRATLEHTHRRLFGFAASAHNKLEWGRDKQFWQGDLTTHPADDNSRWLLGTQFERDKTATDTVLSQRLRIGRSRDAGSVERLVYGEWLRSRQDGATLRIIAQAASLNFNASWRDLDSPLLPTRGLTASLQSAFGAAGSQQGQTGPFGRWYGRVTAYYPLGQAWYGQARLEAGQIVKRDAVLVPDALGFRAGGDESVRGYPYRSLSPLQAGTNIGGNVLATGSVELAHPIRADIPALWGAVFYDAGRAASNWSDWKPAHGYGVGVRWRSPVGPLRVDWAWGSELRRGRLHFSVGIAF